jgi:hypothetical protein
MVRRCAIFLAACAASGFAAQSCAVMSPSSNCADKASCPDDGGGTSSGGVDGTTAETGDDATGAVDETADGPGAADVTVDQVVSFDVRSEDAAALQDVTSESSAGLDGSVDVVVDRAVDAPDDGFDGCGVGPEVCTNGIDDNCDGKIDCADPTCRGYKCAAAVPAGGWIGPVLLWTGVSTATAPACPTGYTTALDAHEGPTGSADTCSCSCAASGQTCSGVVTVHTDQACSSVGCATATATGTCSALTDTVGTCGSGGSIEVGRGAAVAPAGGTCSPKTTTTQTNLAGWSTSVRICAVTVVDSPGGCSPSTETCVPPLATASGFASTPCVYESGDVACPTGYPNDRTVVYSGQSDSRACSGCTCTTSTPSGGGCAGTINLYSGPVCTGTPAVPAYSLGSVCQIFNFGPTPPTSVLANFTVTPGACAVATPAQPTGAVTGTLPTTVCCM